MEFHKFLSDKDFSQEAKDFELEAVRVIMNGGEVDFDDEIIFTSSFTESRGKCIYDYIKEKNGSLFSSTLKNFIDNQEYQLVMDVYNDPTDIASGRTDGSKIDKGIVTIKFNLAYQSDYSMEWASSIFHEGLHAEMYRFVHAKEPGILPGDRERIIQLFLYYKESEWGDDATIQHLRMSEEYVIPLAEALRELDDNQFPIDYYIYFAWDGLISDVPKSIAPTKEEMDEWETKAATVRTQNNLPCD